ncbi:MAG: alcohol dehydrogenase catalytic domain-containing protein [Dehalococcoidales bacterium]|nr:alcohol dehydrogenase catalytic domain-containing protein [Dehalococcoidales bacterium]
MKAAVLYDYGKPLVIEEVDLDPPGNGEVKVRIGAAAICHSDIHDFKGEHGIVTFPAIGGHEIAGYIEEVGEGVTYVKPGDHVVVTIVTAGCGQCYNCMKGMPKLCEKRKSGLTPVVEFTGLSAPGRYVNKQGKRLTQASSPIAGFVEYTTVPEQTLVKIPTDMPLDHAALLACGVISGYGAVLHHARVAPLSSVVVVGCGGVGLNVIQTARIAGARPVIAIDVSDSKLETARTFGATHTINSKQVDDPIRAVQQLTSLRGAEYVFVCVAGTSILRQAFLMSAYHGMTVILGHGFREYLSDFQTSDFVGSERILTGCAMGGTRFNVRVDIPKIIDLYQSGIYKLGELISSRWKLEQINEAIDSVEKGKEIRTVIMFE